MDAYTTALTLLSRRELSATQLRQRLARRRFERDEIEAVIARLTADRTLDDRRVATAYARAEASIKGRGRRRVERYVQQLGVDAETAERAVADVFEEIDESALLDRAIDRRLKGAPPRTLDAKARARLVRYLLGQGFEPAAIFTRLRQRDADRDE